MALTSIPPALAAHTSELPEVAVPSRVAPEDARPLFRLVLLREGRLIHC
ncbi:MULTISPECIES: hypothetical protein [unclassified Streptomyces]|jgi:RNA polymerase sigma-B factor